MNTYGKVAAHYGIAVDIKKIEDSKIKIEKLDFGFKNNNLVVGDLVTRSKGSNKIENLPRKNFLERKTRHGQKILAANIDAIGIIVTATPKTPQSLIEELLLLCTDKNIEPFIIINKIDESKSEAYKNIILTNYAKLEIFQTSAKEKLGLHKLESFLNSIGTSILIGLSGSGKSTLTNALIPNLNLKTEQINQTYSQGKHTTTHATLHTLPGNGELIDAPGIRTFLSTSFSKEYVIDNFNFFCENSDILNQPCQFRQCTHTSEPACVIKEAVQADLISQSRYDTYLALLKQ